MAPSSKCASGFVKGPCDESAKYKLPARKGDFYTTWSFFMCCISSVFALVYAVAQCVLGCSRSTGTRASLKVRAGVHAVLAYAVVPVALWGASNSLGVLATSQLFLGWNFTQGVVTDDAKSSAKKETDKKLGMALPFADAVFQDNFFAHIVPALAAFVVLLLLATGRNGPDVKWWIVFAASAACMVLFCLLYLGIPAVDEDGNRYSWWSKIQYVYNNPQPWMFAAQLVLTALALVIVPACLLNRETPWTAACRNRRSTARGPASSSVDTTDS